MKGIYLGAFRVNHPNYDIDYQDINGKRDKGGFNVHNVIERFLETIHKGV